MIKMKKISGRRLLLIVGAGIVVICSFFLFYYAQDAQLDMAKSELVSITNMNEEWKNSFGKYMSSKEELNKNGEAQIRSKSVGEISWEIYWTSEDVPAELIEEIDRNHTPFLSVDSYRTIMKVKIKNQEFLIEREAGKKPNVFYKFQEVDKLKK
jgi:hypothetical protein